MLHSRSGSKSRSSRYTSRTARRRGLKPQRSKAARARFDTTAQAVRVRRVGGTRNWDLSRERDRAAPADRARTGNRGRPMGGAPERANVRGDPRMPRFQGQGEQRGRRPAAHARPMAVALPWAGTIPLNGKTAFNVAVLALLGWALVWLFTSDHFYVKRVESIGNSQVSEQVLRQVSGLEGYSVFWVNPRQVSARILEALPPVQSVQVRYGFAGRDGLAGWAELYVQERGQEIVWQVAGQSYWVDEAGELHEVRGLVQEAEPAAALEDGAAGSQPEAGQAAAAPRLLIRDIRPSRPAQVDLEAVAGARHLIGLLPEVRALEYAPGSGLRFQHPRGWMVYLGTGEDMAKKVGVLRALEVEFAGEEVLQPTLVDLRFPDSPYYRLPETNGQEGAN